MGECGPNPRIWIRRQRICEMLGYCMLFPYGPKRTPRSSTVHGICELHSYGNHRNQGNLENACTRISLVPPCRSCEKEKAQQFTFYPHGSFDATYSSLLNTTPRLILEAPRWIKLKEIIHKIWSSWVIEKKRAFYFLGKQRLWISLLTKTKSIKFGYSVKVKRWHSAGYRPDSVETCLYPLSL